ncbi:MAG: hypothetical protein GPJ52_00210 [Candidatus Heimdallarchaeota archaeon]|nr:hypothetical protein [Candidatus Heimdallarchaeota archaeon]MCG3253073.1 hypothetical protein [Candidatus Heimdallarchaeota archaeon]MCK4290210.1 hypothetical protein [Candidatus Heimdallarchaeota archaeon]
MSFGSILLGALIGGVISSGGIIGITFLAAVPAILWWHMLLIAVGGTFIGGFVGGLVAKGGGAGALAGLLSGLLVFLGTFLFGWLYYKAQLIALIASAPDVATLVNDFLVTLGMNGTQVGIMIGDWITLNAPTIPEMTAFANGQFIYFALIVGAVLGGLAAVVNFFAGLFGGLITRKKKESYDSYY